MNGLQRLVAKLFRIKYNYNFELMYVDKPPADLKVLVYDNPTTFMFNHMDKLYHVVHVSGGNAFEGKYLFQVKLQELKRA